MFEKAKDYEPFREKNRRSRPEAKRIHGCG